jgi:hypothetical protein
MRVGEAEPGPRSGRGRERGGAGAGAKEGREAGPGGTEREGKGERGDGVGERKREAGERGVGRQHGQRIPRMSVVGASPQDADPVFFRILQKQHGGSKKPLETVPVKREEAGLAVPPRSGSAWGSESVVACAAPDPFLPSGPGHRTGGCVRAEGGPHVGGSRGGYTRERSEGTFDPRPHVPARQGGGGARFFSLSWRQNKFWREKKGSVFRGPPNPGSSGAVFFFACISSVCPSPSPQQS